MVLKSGENKKYDYWDDLYSSSGDFISFLIKRFSNDEKFLLNYYVMANLCKKLNWKVADSVELGCGWGTNSIALHKFGITKVIWLVDISEQALKGAIRVANGFGIKPYAIRADIHNLPFKDNAFDLSLSGGLFEHFIGLEQEELIKENCRICKKVLCQVPENNLTYNLFRFFYTLLKGKWPFGFEASVNKDNFIKLLKKNGLKIIDKDYTNLITGVITKFADNNKFFTIFKFRPFILKLFAYDIIVAGERK